MKLTSLRTGRIVLGAAGLLIFLIISISIVSTLYLRDRELESARQQLANLSMVLAQQSFETMSSAQLAMDSIADVLEAMNIRDDTELRLIAKTKAIHESLKDKITSLPQIDVATIVAANGDVINFTRGFPAPSINLSDRDYFKERRDNPSQDIFISDPVRNKGNGKWVFYLSHRLNDPQGNFLGMVLVGISVEQFSNFYGRLAENLGEGAAVTLYRRDFSVLTRWPRMDESIGKKNLSGSSYHVVQELKKLHDVVYFRGPRFSEGGQAVPRIGAVRVLERFPMIINLTITEEFVLANWRHASGVIALLAAGSCLALAIATMVLLRIVRHQEKSDGLLIRESHKNQLLLHNASDGIHILDKQGNVIEASDSFCRMLGYERSEIMGMNVRHWDAFFNAEQLNDVLAKQYGQSETMKFETRHQRKDGSILDVEVTGNPLTLDGEIVLFNSSRDITDRVHSQNNLQRSQAILRGTLDASDEGILVIGANGKVLTANKRFQTLWSIPDALFSAGDDDQLLTFVLAQLLDPDGFLREVQRLYGSLDSSFDILHFKDGKVFERYSAAIDLPGDHARLWSFRDVTERKKTEDELERHRSNLASLVEERTAALSIAKEAAETASRAKSTFLANMSHELRTPMHGIMGMTALALRLASDTKQRDHLSKAQLASRHLLDIINDILDISRIEAERLTLEKTTFQLSAVFEHFSSMISLRASEKGLGLEIVFPDELAQQALVGDPLRLSQVLLNLTANAIKFTPQGHISVRVIKIQAQFESITLRFEVIDTGIGISPEAQQRLFTAFEQADNSMTRKFGGTGLGLAISRRLVNLMGGDIGVDSEPGVGSTFWFTVTLQKSADTVSRPLEMTNQLPETLLKSKFAGSRVLLAEDEPINQEVACGLLEDAGLQVDLAENGLEAVALARENTYDLILMEMQMPKLNGIYATRAIRLLPNHATTPILAMTANAFEEDRQICLEAGMNEHIGKPVVPEKLFETLLTWLSKEKQIQ